MDISYQETSISDKLFSFFTDTETYMQTLLQQCLLCTASLAHR